ncbi:hypothetical protein Tco_0022693 [Tanacetum coccineum]
MVVQNQQELGKGSAIPTDPHHTPTIIESSLNLKRLKNLGSLRERTLRRVESSRDEDSLGEDASKQGTRINVIDADEDITLVNVQDDAEMFCGKLEGG